MVEMVRDSELIESKHSFYVMLVYVSESVLTNGVLVPVGLHSVDHLFIVDAFVSVNLEVFC